MGYIGIGEIYMLLEEINNIGKDYIYGLSYNGYPTIFRARVRDLYRSYYSSLSIRKRKLMCWVDYVGFDKLKFYKQDIIKSIELKYIKSDYRRPRYDISPNWYCKHGYSIDVITYKHRKIVKNIPIQFVSRNKEDIAKLLSIAVGIEINEDYIDRYYTAILLHRKYKEMLN